jgi:DNA primase
LKRFADAVYLVLDGDAAGKSRTNDILELFVAAQMDLRILTLPDELDPAEFMQERGGEAFRELLSGAVDALEHRIVAATRGIDLVRDTHRANLALEEILTTIARGSPPGTIDMAGLRAQQLLARVARQFNLEEADVRQRFNQLRRSVKGRYENLGGALSISDKSHPKITDLSQAELELFRILTAYPGLVPSALSEISNEELQSELGRLILTTYRSLEETGASLGFGAVMAAIEDPELKNILVIIDEDEACRRDRCERRKETATNPATRLRETIQFFQKSEFDRERRRLETVLEENQVPTEQEVNVVDQILMAKRRQQGISVPTEG